MAPFAGGKEFMMKLTPQAIEQVIKAVEEKFPNELPSEFKDFNEIYRLVGRQDVVRYLYGLLEQVERKPK